MALPQRLATRLEQRLAVKWPWQALKAAGIVGMNARNGHYIARYNQRRLYPLVDDKLRTKKLAEAAGIHVPELYAAIHTEHDIAGLAALLERHERFVIKPAHGAGGEGIVVINGRQGQDFVRAGGQPISLDALQHHASNILSGMFSLGGMPDQAMVEYCVDFDPVFAPITHHGVPDIRTLVFRGVPVCAMVRLPTRESDGKANLHQGAVGAGVNLATGHTVGGVHHNAPVQQHPDTGAQLAHFAIPHWPELLLLAARCYELAPLGYLGVDIVLDRQLGPLMLELNARPGLSIQLATGQGLAPALERIAALPEIPSDALARVRMSVPDFDPNSTPSSTLPDPDLHQEFYF
nr:alpha-L-glutamate ligase-like protein [Oceanococcus sp. HetDA_MAG_MS8]